MDPALIVSAVSMIPFKKLLENSPMLVSEAKKMVSVVANLFNRKGKADVPSDIAALSARIDELEKLEKEQSVLMVGLAQQLEQGLLSVAAMKKKQQLALVLSSISLIVSLVVLCFVLFVK